jgi:hypothetical protein
VTETIIRRKVLKLPPIATFAGVAATAILGAGFVANAVLRSPPTTTTFSSNEDFPANAGRTMNQPRKFHLVFSLVMGAMMVFLMTFVITLVNVGYSEAFVRNWMRAFAIAYVVGVPVIFFLAPVARKITAAILGAPQ